MIFRLRYRQLGGHVHCRLFEVVDHTKTFAKNGDLVFDERSWPEARAMFMQANVDVLKEDDVRADADRMVAPRQPEFMARPMGPWDENGKAKEQV